MRFALNKLGAAGRLLICAFFAVTSCTGLPWNEDAEDLRAQLLLFSFGTTIVSSFKFPAASNQLGQTYTGSISGRTISVRLPHGKVKSAVAVIESSGTVISAGGLSFTNGVTPVDFSSPVLFAVQSPLGTVQNYTVVVYAATPVPDTDQTPCYDGGAVSTCATTAAAFPRQDADFLTTPAPRGTLGVSTNPGFASDYINKDTTTGLIWKACAEGWSGSTCALGGTTTLGQSAAASACSALNSANSGSGYAGIKTWRLPTHNELLQIQRYQVSNVFWDGSVFPNPVAGNHWTSTVVLPGATTGMVSHGTVAAVGVGSVLPVKCVSGGAYPSSDLTDNGDGSITDNRTSLVWQKCAIGQTNDASCSGSATGITWANALTTCKNLTIGGRSWRLPNVNELYTLADFTRTSAPYMNATYFPNVPNAGFPEFWTSTTLVQIPAYAYVLDFSNLTMGTIDTKSTTVNGGYSYLGRCVSGP